MTSILHRFARTKVFDILAVLPLIVFYAFAVAGMAIMARPEFIRLLAAFNWPSALDLASEAVLALFLALQIVLFLRRRPPSAKAQGVLPRAAALFGANLGVAFLAIPRVQMTPALSLVSLALVLAGTAASIGVALWLNRSFAIFPQARELVTTGPYAVVRHPLYMAELVATAGIMLQFVQPWASVVALAIVAAQFPRMRYEEEILGETFPAYRDYAARTARLIPGVY